MKTARVQRLIAMQLPTARLPRLSWPRWIAALALLIAWGAAHAAEPFLDPDAAFKLSASVQGDRTVEVDFDVAPGYYLYREQFRFQATGATLGAARIPPGKVKFDETFQKDVETHRGAIRIAVPVEQAPAAFTLRVTSQGCADRGLCYPPATRALEVRLPAFGGDGSLRVLADAESPSEAAASPAASPATADATQAPARAGGTANPAPANDGSALDATLRRGRFWPVIGVFFVAGLLLSLTPCVLPMLPILSSIIVGQGVQASRMRGLALAASYSFGMALVYTGLGVAAGLAGQGLAASLQNPWVTGAFALGLVAMAFSMFGAYEMRPPAFLSGRLTQASQRLPAGRVAGVFAMGGVSALIVSPCVAAPLAGALIYLSQSRDVWLGGTALFSLAAGMSVPLLLVGASAGALLPRAGAWMVEVRRAFGFVLLGMALWTVQALLPAGAALAAWGALSIAAAWHVAAAPRGRLEVPKTAWRRTAVAALAVVGVLQLAGAASGGSDPLRPVAPLAARLRGEAPPSELAFVPVRSVAELDAALAAPGRPVMLDFYADWCVSCKEMERFTFVDPAVRAKLGAALLLRVDVTANNADDRALLKRFQLFGPPGTIFFDRQGREIAEARLVGYQASRDFVGTLVAAGL